MKGFSFIVFACFLWAFDTLIRYPLLGEGISATKIVFYEHLFLVTFFIPFIFKSYKRVWHTGINNIFYFTIIGVFGSAVATIAFTKAFAIINPSSVILLQKLQPLFAITLAHFVLDEKIRLPFLFWSLVCIAGAVMISYPDIAPLFYSANKGNILASKNLEGYIYTLIAVVSWGGATVFGKKLSLNGYAPKEIMAGRFSLGFIVLIPILISEKYPFQVMEPKIYLKILLMVLISGLLGMFLYYKGLKLVKARISALAELFFPLCAVTVNWIVLGKELAMVQIAGGVILIGASAVIELKKY